MGLGDLFTLFGDVSVKCLLMKEDVKGQLAVPLYLKVPLY
jgi:hypothetical protein